MNWYKSKITLAIAMIIFGGIYSAQAEDLILASTTSTQNSGLFDYLLPVFEKETGIKVHVVAVGTGAALKLARKGDADVLMVHHKISEEKFVAEGYGVERFDLMHNDFIILGPDTDPAQIKSIKDLDVALQTIAKSGTKFLSRGDDSGTHKRELELWHSAGVDVKAASGNWYLETGSGMGATLNTAVGVQGYVLADRATWLNYKNKQNMAILQEGDSRLFNQYGVIMVNPKLYSHVKQDAAQRLIDWLLSATGQAKIASYTIAGQQLFTPDALH